MNCQDISLVLDDRDIGALSDTERRDFDAHLGACPDCALDWKIHQRMLATPTPPMPPALPAEMRALFAARSGVKGGRRAINRFVLLGAVLAVGVAAAMLAIRISGVSTSPAQVAARVPVATPVVAPLAASDDASPAAVAEQGEQHPEEKQVPASEVVAAVKPFTVRVLPLENDVKDPESKAAIASLYDAFLERLRAVPGLKLLDPGPESANELHPDFRITMTGMESGRKFAGTLRADLTRADGTVRSSVYTSTGELALSCAGITPVNTVGAEPSTCIDASTAATNLVGNLRRVVFPPDPSLQRQLQLRVADRSLDAKQRLDDLWAVSQFGKWYVGGEALAATPGQALRDPALLRGAIDLATNAPDPFLRADVWATLRGVGSAELVRPLLIAFHQDSNGEVRLAALGTLAADFSKDPRVHAAFEAAAQQDARPLVRALAQRTLSGFSGDGAWKDYIVASLKDTNRSAVERTEALFYHMGLPVVTRSFDGVRAPAAASIFGQFDHEAIKALVDVLPKVQAASSIAPLSAARLLGDLSRVDDPAITDMLLASLNGGSQWIDRATPINALIALPSRRGDARVRTTLEKIATDDPDPQLRQTVTAWLQDRPPPLPADVVVTAPAVDKAAAPDSAVPPVRFGVNLSSLVAGPFVPPEMVGKAVVSAVTPGLAGQKAGVREGDILLEINSSPLTVPADIVRIVAATPRGVDVEVLVYRGGEKVSLKARF